MNTNEHVLLELYDHTYSNRKLWLEPWGEQVTLPPMVTWRLTCINSDPSMVSIEFHEDGIAIHGIPDATMRVYVGDEMVWESFQPFSPPKT